MSAAPGYGNTPAQTSSAYAIVGADVALADRLLQRHAVVVENGRIAGILPEHACDPGLARHRLDGGILAPGFIDVHVHGAAGASFNDGDITATASAARAILAAGVTTLLPTLASAAIPQLLEGLDAVREASVLPDMPRFAGAHLEGPYFSSAQRGAQSEAHLRDPADGSADALLERSAEIRMVSLAPELPGALALVERLVDLGIVAAAGHTDGTIDDLVRAQQAGLSHVIHLYSGQSTTKREGPWRVPGMLEASLASNDLTVEIIADGKHLPPALMTIAYRALGDRVCLVSDATSGAGMPDGSRYRMGPSEYLVDNGVGVTLDHSSFGGSTTLLPAMLPIARDALGIGVIDAIAMVSSIPARAARLENVGQIALGAHADFVHLNDRLEVLAVARDGVWNAGRDHH
ncbi:N-acetylglucosamine-6-phosphate deacetylase [Microbacterium sp.]|uniref:N-acetylglucosamine-6-phosphate deacetylase n=1 Tax=Microbacterium sp. TaxID=51671 RepID=UPI003F99CDF7